MTYVPGDGPPDARIVIVGEAPGANEEAQGRPFVGRAGKVLSQLLSVSGILREQCYITNVVKERPPNNDITHFIDLKYKNPRVTSDAEIYLRSFQMEMQRLQPNVIVPMGNIGLWALTGNKGILKWRGSIIPSPYGKVIPTIHPSATFHTPIWKYWINKDLERISEQSRFPEIPPDDRTYILKPTLDEVYDYLDACEKEHLIAFDIEVSNQEVSCISFSYDRSHAISIPFTEQGREYFMLPQEADIWRRIARLLEDPNIAKVGHNLTFDATFLFRKYGIRSTNLHDTMIAQGILYPDFPKGLGFVTTWWTLIPYYKDEGKESMKAQDNEGFWLYNAKDSIVLMEALPKMIHALKQQGNLETYLSQCQLIEPLLYMTEKGMRVDLDSLAKRSEELALYIEEKEALLNGTVGRDLNAQSPKQLLDYFYKERGHQPYLSQQTGRPTTDEKALKRLARKGERAASIILDIRGAQKLKGTYIDVTLDTDKRLRGSFNPIGTVTLRLSSSKDIFGVGTNMQTLPPKMKENIIPDDDHVLVEVDLAQAENRIVAYIAPDETMISAFEQDRDIHSQTAGLLFDMDPAEVRSLYKEFELTHDTSDKRLVAPIGQGNKPWRYWGKEANHALNYGLGYGNASLRWEIPQKDGKFLYDRYHHAYPGVRTMHRWIKQSLDKTRTIENLFGFKRLFLDLRKPEEAYAFPAQSTIAELINRHGVKYLYYDKETFPHAQLLGQVHDSIVFQFPIAAGWEELSIYLNCLRISLEEPLSFRGRTFSIPIEVTLFPTNLSNGVALHSFEPDSIAAAYESHLQVA